MPTNKIKKLLQESEAALYSNSNVQAAGSDSLDISIVSNVELYNKIKDCIKSHVAEEAEDLAGERRTGNLVLDRLQWARLHAFNGQGVNNFRSRKGSCQAFC